MSLDLGILDEITETVHFVMVMSNCPFAPFVRLAAVALLVLQNEEDAFWCLVAVVETIMPQDFYSKTQTACQVCQISPV